MPAHAQQMTSLLSADKKFAACRVEKKACAMRGARYGPGGGREWGWGGASGMHERARLAAAPAWRAPLAVASAHRSAHVAAPSARACAAEHRVELIVDRDLESEVVTFKFIFRAPYIVC